MTAPQKRIALAFILGMVLVTSAFIMGKSVKANSVATPALTALAQRQYIDVKDDDHNGIPNWQDELLTQDPINLSKATSTTYTPPTTVTGKVAMNLFKNIVDSNKYGVFGNTNTEIAQKAVQEIAQESKGVYFSPSDIKVLTDFDSTTLRLYGDEVASVFLVPAKNSKSEITIFQDALQYNTPQTLTELDPIIAAYGTMLTSLVAIDVPKPYASEHLLLLNSLNAVHEDIVAMRNVDNDALYAFARVKRYQTDVQQLSKAITALFDTLYSKDNVRWADGESTLKLMKF